MRYRKNVTFCAQDGRRLPAQHFVSRPDTAWIGRGAAFSTPNAKRRCTLLAVWYVEQEEPWIILTGLPPEDAGPSWYALRFWIELGFKAVKSLGWKWDQTRRTDPARISRHWLVLSVATLLALAYGTRVEDAHDAGLPQATCARRPRRLPQAPRPLGQAGTDRQRHPPRHRLAAAVAAPRTALEPGLAAARTLAGTQTKSGDYSPCPCVKTSYIPLSGPGTPTG